jgi:two-component system, OmpR family, phosphate regulon sensor histidine kinase PhoR
VFFRKKVIQANSAPALQETTSSTQNEVHHILAAFNEPVVVLDKLRIVRYANQSALDLFGKSIVGRNVVQCFRQPHIIDAIETVFKTKVSWEGETNFSGIVQRHLSLRISMKGDEDGVVILVKDTTMIKRTEEMRSDFVANVSHELRSPLSAILGFIETLQGPAKNDSVARERFLNIMIQEANRMARLIDDLLSLSRVQIQEHVLPKDDVNIYRLLKNIVDILSVKAEQSNMSLKLSCADEDLLIQGDGDQITQVFQNLVDNAIKYGKPGKFVEITCNEIPRLPNSGQRGVAVEVRDFGDGISEEHLPRLTERFYRVDKARSRHLGGTGLGLAIAKHIVQRHRGRLNVESKLGVGTTFTVKLPMKL